MLSILRFQLNARLMTKYTSRTFHNTKGRHAEHSGGAYFDQYAAHSPLQISRHKLEELRSKIFFEHPPIPNRIPKFFLLFCFVAIFSTAVRDKFLRRQKKFAREQERYMFRLIVPFVQAMEDVRFTALEQKKYMITKAICDATNPGLFEHVRRRYNQEDIYVPGRRIFNRSQQYGKPVQFNQNPITNSSTFAPNTFYDKGLFDAREIGYIY